MNNSTNFASKRDTVTIALLAVMHFATSSNQGVVCLFVVFFLVEKKLPPLDFPVQTKGCRKQSQKVITGPFLP